MADGHKHSEEPCNLILQEDNATLLKEARVSSKEIVPTYLPTYLPTKSHYVTSQKNVTLLPQRGPATQLRSMLRYPIIRSSLYCNADAGDAVLMLKKANISQRNLSVTRKEHDATRLSASLSTHGQPQIFQGVNDGRYRPVVMSCETSCRRGRRDGVGACMSDLCNMVKQPGMYKYHPR